MKREIKVESQSPQTEIKKSKKKRKREKLDAVQNDQLTTSFEKSDVQLQSESALDVKVEVIFDQTDKTPPVVGYFPSGYKPCKQDKSNEENVLPALVEPSVRFYRHAQRTIIGKSSSERSEKLKGSERMELVVNPAGTNVDFVGKSYKGEATAAQTCTYALGVLDKETQTLKIMPIAGNKIFRLEPKVRGYEAPEDEPPNVELSRQNKTERMNVLNASYGTKKAIAQSKKMEVLRREDNPDSQMDLDKKIDNVVVNKEALESTSAHVARNIPPHNTSATTPEEAYPLSRIILTGEWDYLEDVYETLNAEEGVASDAYPYFVRNRIHKLRGIQDEVERKTYSRIFSYITHLLKFKDRYSMDGGSSARNHNFPKILRQKFLGLFTPESYKLPAEKIDLLISYVLVLTLYADDFRTDPTDIAKDLRMSTVVLRLHFENLGCKMISENKLSLATLPVPLNFPVLRQRRRRR